MVFPRFYKWIYIFKKKVSKKILMRKIWDHVIDTKKEFVLRKRKIYLLSGEERGNVCEFINEQLRKKYIRPQSHFKWHQCSL